MRLLLALLCVFAILPATAQAAAITPSYCEYSLRGGGTLAPDNDILAKWNELKAQGYVLNRSYFDHYTRGNYGVDIIYMYWVYVATVGNRYAIFACWRDGSSVFHDGFIQWGWNF